MTDAYLLKYNRVRITGHFVLRTLRTQDILDPQNLYCSVRTLITYNLAYNCSRGSECPDDRNVLRHFGTGSKVSRACLWDRSVLVSPVPGNHSVTFVT